MEVLLPLRPWHRRAGLPVALYRRARLVSPWCRPTGTRAGQTFRLLAGRIRRERPGAGDELCVLFLAKGRSPVLINKLRHGGDSDWNSDPDDVANLVGIVSRDWKSVLSWQTVDSSTATVADLRRAPILFCQRAQSAGLLARTATESTSLRRRWRNDRRRCVLRQCRVRQGFQETDGGNLSCEGRRVAAPARRSRDLASQVLLAPETQPLWGIRRPARTVVIYAPNDLSCFWNQSERSLGNPAVIAAIKIGQNIVDYVTRREMPPDKLSER